MAPRTVLRVARKVSKRLDEQQVPHALAAGLAAGLHGLDRWTTSVEFVVPPSARQAIEQLWTTTPLAVPLKGIAVTVDRVGVALRFVQRPLRRSDISSPARLAGLPVLGLAALVSMKLGTGCSTDILDVIELLELGKVCLEDVAARLAGRDREQFRDLMAIADLEKKGKPKEGRRLMLAVLTRSAGLKLEALKLRRP